MHHVSESLDWSYTSILGAILGYILHVMMSWKEWRKLAGKPCLTLRAFLADDIPGQVTGFLCVVFVYGSLSALSQWDGMKQMVGFVPKVDFFSAAVTAFTAQGICIKLMNMLRKVTGPDDPPTR